MAKYRILETEEGFTPEKYSMQIGPLSGAVRESWVSIGDTYGSEDKAQKRIIHYHDVLRHLPKIVSNYEMPD